MANWSDFCSSFSFSTESSGRIIFWIPVLNDFGICSHDLFHSFSHAVLLVGTAYFVGVDYSVHRSSSTSRRRLWNFERKSWYFRLLAIISVILTILVRLAILLSQDDSRKRMAYSGCVRDALTLFAWTLFLAQTIIIIRTRNSLSERSGSQLLSFFLWFPVCTAFVFEVWSAFGGIFQFLPGVYSVCAYVLFAAQCLVAMSFISVLWNPYYGLSTTADTRTFIPLTSTYVSAGFVSKLLFLWVKPLVQQGRYIRSTNDLYALPNSWDFEKAGESFRQRIATSAKNSRTWLITAWFGTWGLQWLLIGFLLTLSVAAEYAAPVFLQKLVTYFEDDAGGPDGYYWAVALMASQIVSWMLNVHCIFLREQLSTLTTGAMMDTVYRKLFHIYSADIATSDMSGKVINLIGTDCDRISHGLFNLHDIWILPVQIIISLYLLYWQVGISFLAGLGVVLSLLVVNQFVSTWLVKFEEKKQAAADGRIKVVQEVLNCIRVIKFHVWEEFFQRRVTEAREKELGYLKLSNLFLTGESILWSIVPVGMSIGTFSMYVALGNTLTAARVFTSVAVIHMMYAPLLMVSWQVVSMIETWVSTKRVQSYLALPEISAVDYYDDPTKLTSMIAVGEASFSWQDTEEYETKVEPLLESISFIVRPGEFIGISGKIGSGKSVLLNAIIGELRKTSGSISIVPDLLRYGFALAAQEPWIMQGTVKQNVVFGSRRENDEEWFKLVVRACALEEDIANLPSLDQTEIGERGVTLSGGQKARLALARAVFQDKDVIIMDDPLAAVDPLVAVQLYEKCIQGVVKSKTRILVSHNTNFLRDCDRVLLMDGGRLVADGPPAEVFSRPEFAEQNEERVEVTRQRKPFKRMKSTASTDSREKAADGNDEENEEVAPLIAEEETETGTVNLQVYLAYVRAVGWPIGIAVLVFMTIGQGFYNGTDIWLSLWITHAADASADTTRFYFSIFGGLSGGTVLAGIIWPFLLFGGAYLASRIIHRELLHAVLRGRIHFFDSTPSGRILNRFSNDIASVDQDLPLMALVFWAEFFGAIGTFCVMLYALPVVTLVLVPACFAFYFIQKFYRNTSRELKRLNAKTLSPLYSLYSESIDGLVTIRCMRSQEAFRTRFASLITSNLRVDFAVAAAEQWLHLCLGLLGWIIIGAVLIIGFVMQTRSASFGLALSYSLAVLQNLIEVVETFIQYEKSMVNVERIQQYVKNIEPERFDGPLTTTPDWPQCGEIDIHNLHLRYRDDLPDVLDDISIRIRAGEKVGIVGRTGAGKSSLMMALFRMVESSAGSISIDGIKICHINLRHLRSHLTIIPQTPCIFNASIRDNLDPLHVFEDHAVWSALEVCHLKPLVEKLGDGLKGAVGQNGRNLSAGEKQLVSLARAILSKSKVICFDEATANVDYATDQLIQQTIREQLSECTILTIAHRVQTVLDSDRIIVMSSGRIIEEGSPQDLMRLEHSRFAEMVQQSQSTGVNV